MNAEAVSQLFFDERHVVPRAPHAQAVASPRSTVAAPVDAMAGGHLVALLESLCIGSLQRCVDDTVEAIVGAGVDGRHRGPILAGACLRLTGWVERVGERGATFFVQAQDEHEQVFEGTVQLAVVDRGTLADLVKRKAQTIDRRKLFAETA